MAERCSPFLVSPAAWRLRVDGALTGQDNMRIDEELLDAQKDPQALPVLRFFRWAHPTISYGRLQSIRLARAQARASRVIELIQRPTGGGVVRHHKDLSFSLAWRRDHPAFSKCLKDAYRGLHETVQGALKQKGIEADLHVPAAKRASGEGICFAEPAEDDLIWKGKKILGGALRVTGWGRLYQGNLLAEELGLTAESLVADLRRAFEAYFKKPPVET